MTDQELFDAINTRKWYTDMQNKAAQILGVMQQDEFTIQGDDAWVASQVDGVDVRFHLEGQNVHAQVAMQASGEWMYDWHFPVGWVMP